MRRERMRQKTNGMEEEGQRCEDPSCQSESLIYRRAHLQVKSTPRPASRPSLVFRHFRKQIMKLLQDDMFRHFTGLYFWLFPSVCSSEVNPGQTCLYSNSLTGSPECQISRGASGHALTGTRVWGGASAVRAC